MHQLIYNKIIIVDFDDSNTFNIASILFPFEKKIEVIHYLKFFNDNFFINFLDDLSLKAVILGPGPGHPNQYSKFFPKIMGLINNSKIYTMGICLGHQLILNAFGYLILNSKNPSHGIPYKINFRGIECEVQRYNSLAVLGLNKRSEELSIDGEVVIFKLKQGITYQFHPESIATSNQLLFFEELILFIR